MCIINFFFLLYHYGHLEVLSVCHNYEYFCLFVFCLRIQYIFWCKQKIIVHAQGNLTPPPPPHTHTKAASTHIQQQQEDKKRLQCSGKAERRWVSSLCCPDDCSVYLSTVTSVQLTLWWSACFCMLLQAGYYDGGVAIYNVRRTTDEPILDTQ